jgi:hypothetical protein
MRTRLLVLGTALGVLASCGGSSEAAVPPSTTAPAAAAVTTPGGALTPEQQQALQAYRQCLQDNGVTAGGRAPGGRGTQGGQGGNDASSGSTSPRPSIDPAVLQKAQEACKATLPAGLDPTALGRGGQGQGDRQGQGQGDRQGQGQGQGDRQGRGGGNLAQLQPYLTCLRDNGVVVPERPAGDASAPASSAPSAAGGAPPADGRGGGLGQIDRTSPVFQAANEKCKVLLPEGMTLPGGRSDATAPTTTGA